MDLKALKLVPRTGYTTGRRITVPKDKAFASMHHHLPLQYRTAPIAEDPEQQPGRAGHLLL